MALKEGSGQPRPQVKGQARHHM